MGKRLLLTLVFLAVVILVGFSQPAVAQLKPGEPIVIEVPTALGSIEGRDGCMAVS